MVLGIVVTAVGIEQAIAHAPDADALGIVAAVCLLLGPRSTWRFTSRRGFGSTARIGSVLDTATLR